MASHQKHQKSIPLPWDTQTVLEEEELLHDNYGLRINRFLDYDQRKWELTDDSKRRFVPLQDGKRALRFNTRNITSALQAFQERWDSMLETLEHQGYVVKKYQLWAASRVIVGLGAESVLETSIRLHRIYGFPIIPGSALKGLARAYAELIEGKDESNTFFVEVFGKGPPEAQAGEVIFFDAIPANPNTLTLELDVMNPHYASYYQGAAPPADYHNPVPIFFLTIGSESSFLFAVAARKERSATLAQNWLTQGLQEMGIGAKTVAGYGLWKDSPGSNQNTPMKHAAQKSPEVTQSPDRPSVLKQLPRKATERIPAEVVDNRQKPIKVRLLVEGYQDRIIPCTGARNLESFSPGTYIWVTISQRTKKGTIIQVALAGIWRPQK